MVVPYGSAIVVGAGRIRRHEAIDRDEVRRAVREGACTRRDDRADGAGQIGSMRAARDAQLVGGERDHEHAHHREPGARGAQGRPSPELPDRPTERQRKERREERRVVVIELRGRQQQDADGEHGPEAEPLEGGGPPTRQQQAGGDERRHHGEEGRGQREARRRSRGQRRRPGEITQTWSRPALAPSRRSGAAAWRSPRGRTSPARGRANGRVGIANPATTPAAIGTSLRRTCGRHKRSTTTTGMSAQPLIVPANPRATPPSSRRRPLSRSLSPWKISTAPRRQKRSRMGSSSSVCVACTSAGKTAIKPAATSVASQPAMTDQHPHHHDVQRRHQRHEQPRDGERVARPDGSGEQGQRAGQQCEPGRLNHHEVAIRQRTVHQTERRAEVGAVVVLGHPEEHVGTAQLIQRQCPGQRRHGRDDEPGHALVMDVWQRRAGQGRGVIHCVVHLRARPDGRVGGTARPTGDPATPQACVRSPAGAPADAPRRARTPR